MRLGNKTWFIVWVRPQKHRPGIKTARSRILFLLFDVVVVVFSRLVSFSHAAMNARIKERRIADFLSYDSRSFEIESNPKYVLNTVFIVLLCVLDKIICFSDF